MYVFALHRHVHVLVFLKLEYENVRPVLKHRAQTNIKKKWKT